MFGRQKKKKRVGSGLMYIIGQPGKASCFEASKMVKAQVGN